MKLYHFCAMRQGRIAGELSYFDGTVTTNADLGNADQYRGLKREISSYMDGHKGIEGLIVLSLTLLGDS